MCGLIRTYNVCTGDGLCGEICPEIFEGHDDGLYYVKEVEWPNIYKGNTDKDPVYKMAAGTAEVPMNLLEAVIESAEDCPGECIFIEGL